MTGAESLPSIEAVRAGRHGWLDLTWSNGQSAEIDLSSTLEAEPFAELRRPNTFEQVRKGDWGHSVVWPGGTELGADSLWLESLSSWGFEDTRTFLEWRLRNGFSASRAAEALGLSKQSVTRYSGGEVRVPRSVLLACRGWDAMGAAA